MKIYDFIYDKLNKRNKKKKRPQRPYAPSPKRKRPIEEEQKREEKKSDRGVTIIKL